MGGLREILGLASAFLTPLGEPLRRLCVSFLRGDATPKCNTQRIMAPSVERRDQVSFDSDYSGEDDASPFFFP